MSAPELTFGMIDARVLAHMSGQAVSDHMIPDENGTITFTKPALHNAMATEFLAGMAIGVHLAALGVDTSDLNKIGDREQLRHALAGICDAMPNRNEP